MNVRIVAVCTLLAAWLLCPALVEAQQETEAVAGAWAKALGLVTQSDFARLQHDVAAVSADVNALRETIEGAIQPPATAPLVPLTPLAPPDRVTDSATREYLETTQHHINGLWDRVFELEQVQGQIAQGISRSDGETLHTMRLLGNMDDSPEFEQEVSEAVHRVLRRRGTLIIENQTEVGHTVRVVNTGRSVYIPRRQVSEPIDVPVGTVTTELMGYEGPRNWNVGPPSYEQRIRITQGAASVRILNVTPLPLLAPRSYQWDPVFGGWVEVVRF